MNNYNKRLDVPQIPMHYSVTFCINSVSSVFTMNIPARQSALQVPKKMLLIVQVQVHGLSFVIWDAATVSKGKPFCNHTPKFCNPNSNTWPTGITI